MKKTSNQFIREMHEKTLNKRYISFGSFMRFRTTCKLETLKEAEKIIDNLDIEKFQGKYCFKARSFKKELKKRLAGLNIK